MEPIVPYIMFKGEAKHALEFYAEALQGKIEFMQTYADAPGVYKDEVNDLIMHGSVRAGDLVIMVSDAVEPNDATVRGNSIHLSINFTDVEKQTAVFHALAVGGKVSMPLDDTFWGARFGMLVDQFGMHWMFNYDYPKAEN